MSQVRLFVSIELPPIIRDALVQLQKDIESTGSVKATLVKEDQLHITLAFLGHADARHIPEIITALKTVSFQSFQIELPSLSLYPSENDPKMIWVHAHSTELDELALRIQSILNPFGASGQHAFIGHITLMRIKEISAPHALRSFISVRNPLGFSYKVDRFVLKESKLIADRPVHIQIAEFEVSS